MFANWLTDTLDSGMKFLFMLAIALAVGIKFLAKAAPNQAAQVQGSFAGALIKKLFGGK